MSRYMRTGKYIGFISSSFSLKFSDEQILQSSSSVMEISSEFPISCKEEKKSSTTIIKSEPLSYRVNLSGTTSLSLHEYKITSKWVLIGCCMFNGCGLEVLAHYS